MTDAPPTAPLDTDRRAFFRAAAGAAIAGAAIAVAPPAAAQTIGDGDILNFALNLEYLEAQFYSYAVTGGGIASGLTGGTGNAGAVLSTGARAVDFSGDPIIGRMAAEIAGDETAHVTYLRSQLGNTAVAQPVLDLSVGASSAFSVAAQAAGIVAAGAVFDPYASIDNFLLAAFLFEDLGVTAYKGAAPLISSKSYLEAAAGILAVEAYHAAMLRTQLYNRGQTNTNLIAQVQSLSDARDSLDGGTDLDQGVTSTTSTTTDSTGASTTVAVSNIVPTDANGIVFTRSTGQVLNIAYLTKAQATAGGFFRAGVNGAIATSIAQ